MPPHADSIVLSGPFDEERANRWIRAAVSRDELPEGLRLTLIRLIRLATDNRSGAWHCELWRVS